jgi:hypothetical protein
MFRLGGKAISHQTGDIVTSSTKKVRLKLSLPWNFAAFPCTDGQKAGLDYET